MHRLNEIYIVLSLSLASCDVHFGNHHYNVPWQIIAIPVLLICAVICIAAHRSIISKTYVCPDCGTKFRPGWYNISSWIHLNGERVLKCPHCRRKGFCRPAD